MKKAFTLIEIVIVLVVISILMTATMKFGSNRIDDLKAQSLKEQFVGYYNDLYRQNLMSSFRDEKKYQTLMLTFQTGTSYRTDITPPVIDPKLADVIFTGLALDTHPFPNIDITLVPYIL
jgi:prepilin-type N-terminal cleavage/methylation domain-containing protein